METADRRSLAPDENAGQSLSPRATLGALGLVVVLLVGLVGLTRLAAVHGSSAVGRDAPDFSLPIVANGEGLGQGTTLALGGLRGHAVVLDFWATWCPPCRVEAPIVDQVAHRWKDRGVVVVGVDTDLPDQGDPREFAISHGLTYPVVHDVSGEVSRLYNIENLPTLVIMSPTGKIVALRTGITDATEIDRLLRRALD
jgi:cytochrome c biogenesis protein CcmG, thiol:disulfide interchange protein DsbE